MPLKGRYEGLANGSWVCISGELHLASDAKTSCRSCCSSPKETIELSQFDFKCVLPRESLEIDEAKMKWQQISGSNGP